jgi:3',5'-cyclic AMP phosphodiesterase CpdA
MTSLHFAQISDIHISAQGDHHDQLSGHAADFLAHIVAELNQMETLDFVLISGDLFDTAVQTELEEFQAAIAPLQKPYYVIPGNHDRREPGSTVGLTRHEFAQIFNPQVAARPMDPTLQAGYWSLEVAEGVQLLGLDSIVDEDWNGRVDAPQLAWLEEELKRHADKFVMVTIHHPLHKLAPIDDIPRWRKFVCDNGSELLAIFERQPQVKIVLTGHHHLSKADRLGERLHLACPAVGLYPCAYRSLHLSQPAEGGWQVEWRTHSATTEATIALAREKMHSAWLEVADMSPDFVELHIDLAKGSESDQAGKVVW